jgi:hypothetical protein
MITNKMNLSSNCKSVAWIINIIIKRDKPFLVSLLYICPRPTINNDRIVAIMYLSNFMIRSTNHLFLNLQLSKKIERITLYLLSTILACAHYVSKPRQFQDGSITVAPSISDPPVVVAIPLF